MTFVYGDPVLERRDQVWKRLTRFSTTQNGPWFMIGDFNEITDHSEKEGGRRRSDSSFLPFKQMLSDCGMLEFPFSWNKLYCLEKDLEEQVLDAYWIEQWAMRIGMKSFLRQLSIILGFGDRAVVRS